MIIIGAKGHAKEILEIVREMEYHQKVFFFDDISDDQEFFFYGYPIIKNIEDLENLFKVDNAFTLGLGNPLLRSNLYEIFKKLGGQPISMISKRAFIAENVDLGVGINIMPFCVIYNDAKVGDGVLINTSASVHHDAHIGKFTELSPGCRVLGHARIGDLCMIGANAVILPRVKISNNVTIGAGAVVTNDILETGTYVGVPAKKII